MVASRKRVMFICTNADEAGAPRYVENLCGMCLDSYDVLCIFGEDGPVVKRLRERGVAVRVVRAIRSSINPANDLWSVLTVLYYCSVWRPHVINSHSSKAGMIGRIVSILIACKSVYTVHGWGWRGLGVLGRRLTIVAEWFFARLPHGKYIFVSDSVAKEGKQLLGIGNNRSCVIYSGVPDLVGEFYRRPETNRIRLLMAARVCDAKDHVSLIKAFETLSPEFELWLCGSGTDQEIFRDLTRVAAPTRWMDIKYIGQTSQIEEYYQMCDVFVLSSKYEALPISIIEAMSFGLPVVSSGVGGVSELIEDGVSGYLSLSGDYLDLAEKISRLRLYKDRIAMGLSGRLRYQYIFTNTKMFSRFQEVFDAI